MALIVSFKNVTELEPLSDYKVDVWINDHHIDGPFLLKHHKREDGWQALVKLFARNLQDLMTKAKIITRNIIRCKLCGVLLESRDRHDFRECKCGTFVDGGIDYVRVGWQGGKDINDCIEFLTEYKETK